MSPITVAWQSERKYSLADNVRPRAPRGQINDNRGRLMACAGNASERVGPLICLAAGDLEL